MEKVTVHSRGKTYGGALSVLSSFEIREVAREASFYNPGILVSVDEESGNSYEYLYADGVEVAFQVLDRSQAFE
jgi:hypothetical protein